MAAYFIDYIKTYSNTNNKERELQQFIGKYVQRLVKDDLSMDALKAEIEQEIEQLNKAYPRTQQFSLTNYRNMGQGQWIVWVKGNCDKMVFVLHWLEVLGTYQFCEKNEGKEIEQ